MILIYKINNDIDKLDRMKIILLPSLSIVLLLAFTLNNAEASHHQSDDPIQEAMKILEHQAEIEKRRKHQLDIGHGPTFDKLAKINKKNDINIHLKIIY